MMKDLFRSTPARIVQYLLLLGIGGYLGFLFFRDLDLDSLRQQVVTGNFSWFYLVMLVSLGVYIVRVLRWKLLLRAAGHPLNFWEGLSSLSIGYFVNFAVPRLGEVTRCLSLKNNNQLPFLSILGTVIIERVVDILSLFVFLLITLLLQFDQILDFMKVNVFHPIYDNVILKLFHERGWVLLTGICLLLLMVVLLYHFRKVLLQKIPGLFRKFILSFQEGLTSIAKMEQKALFWFYTVLIWLGYYLMTYFWFFVFADHPNLGWGACLSIVAIGTVGRSVPIQGGGMGAYHFLVTQVVVLYGVSESFGKNLAVLIHGGQTFFTFLMGLFGLLVFFVRFWMRRN